MKRLLFALLAFWVLACSLQGRIATTTSTPPAPVPLAGVNSAWDDFNASKPLNWDWLVFSSNRGSKGHDFDLWTAEVVWNAQPKTYKEPVPFSPTLMSEGDERGPLLVNAKTWGIECDPSRLVLVMASDRTGGAGGLDLYWAEDCPQQGWDCTGPLHAMIGINSPANDAYLSLPFDDERDRRGGSERKALFASDRGGNGYDIYEAAWRKGRRFFFEAPATIRRVNELSSDADDNAPYVAELGTGRVELVFASKRAGGLGEHDIWCSRLWLGKWEPPVNLGPGINTPQDEFRPSIVVVDGATFLVFSSTRPGGAGGYDLYTVKYPGCTPTG
jgi:hypothetical protein